VNVIGTPGLYRLPRRARASRVGSWPPRPRPPRGTKVRAVSHAAVPQFVTRRVADSAPPRLHWFFCRV